MNDDLQEQTQENSLDTGLEQGEFTDNILEDEPESIREAKEPEISIQNGEVNFRDDFFDDVPDNKATGDIKQKEQEQAPNYYTDEELQNIPVTQWDKARMPDEVKRYFEAYQRQAEFQARQQEIQKRAQTPPAFLPQPKQYTPKELHEEAMKLAVQKLGLENVDDFDIYEGEHTAALAMARNEILQKNAIETAIYQRKAGEYANFQNFSAELAGQSDFNEFQSWYLDELRKNGNTPEQINTGLKDLADSQGFGAVQRIWAEFYRRFKANKQQTQKPRAKTPPTLESTQGGNAGNRKIYNMRDFGKLDEDAQVQALMDMGIV